MDNILNTLKQEFKQGTIKGLLGMGSFILTASLFSSPLLGIIIGLVVLILVKKSLKKLDVTEIYDWFKNQFKKHGTILSALGGGAIAGLISGYII